MKSLFVSFISAAIVFTLTAIAPASAGEWGQRGDTNIKVRSVSNSYSQSSSSSRSSINQQDRLQAPGFGVGGGYCSNAFSVAFPGGGLGFSAMERMCKLEKGADIVSKYVSKGDATAYVCNQAEFAQVPTCRAAKRLK